MGPAQSKMDVCHHHHHHRQIRAEAVGKKPTAASAGPAQSGDWGTWVPRGLVMGKGSTMSTSESQDLSPDKQKRGSHGHWCCDTAPTWGDRSHIWSSSPGRPWGRRGMPGGVLPGAPEGSGSPNPFVQGPERARGSPGSHSSQASLPSLPSFRCPPPHCPPAAPAAPHTCWPSRSGGCRHVPLRAGLPAPPDSCPWSLLRVCSPCLGTPEPRAFSSGKPPDDLCQPDVLSPCLRSVTLSLSPRGLALRPVTCPGPQERPSGFPGGAGPASCEQRGWLLGWPVTALCLVLSDHRLT